MKTLDREVVHWESPNGLHVVVDPIDTVATVSVQIAVGTGSMHEAPDEHGLAHLLEHMLFSGGTKTRTEEQIFTDMEDIGGHINAMTSMELTVFDGWSAADDIERTTEILSDIVVNPVFDEETFEKEKNVIAAEMGERGRDPIDLVQEQIFSVCYEGHGMGHDTGGTEESVRALTLEQVKSFYEQHYRPSNIIVSAAGNIIPKDFIRQMGSALLDGLPNGGAPRTLKPEWKPGRWYEEREDAESLDIILAFEGIERGHPDKIQLDGFSCILGVGPASLLQTELRMKRGLCYDVSCMHAPFMDTGHVQISATVMKDKAEAFVHQLMMELRVAALDVSERRVERVKAKLRSALLAVLESTPLRSMLVNDDIRVHGKTRRVGQLLELIDRMTVEGVRAAGEKMLSSPMAWAFVAPTGSAGKIEEELLRER